jgi:hypothetical protein
MTDISLGRCACLAVTLSLLGCSSALRLTAGPTYVSSGPREGVGAAVFLSGSAGLAGTEQNPVDISATLESGGIAHARGVGAPLGGGVDVSMRAPKLVGRAGFRGAYVAADDPSVDITGLLGVARPLGDGNVSLGAEVRGGAVRFVDTAGRPLGAETMVGGTLEIYRPAERHGSWWGDF